MDAASVETKPMADTMSAEAVFLVLGQLRAFRGSLSQSNAAMDRGEVVSASRLGSRSAIVANRIGVQLTVNPCPCVVDQVCSFARCSKT